MGLILILLIIGTLLIIGIGALLGCFVVVPLTLVLLASGIICVLSLLAAIFL